MAQDIISIPVPQEKQCLELDFAQSLLTELEQYIQNPTDDANSKLSPLMRCFIANKDPAHQLAKLKKAIELYQYKPKNMSILDLADNADLHLIGGDFNTYNPNLTQAIKNKKYDKVRDSFAQQMPNLPVVVAEMVDDWVERMKRYEYVIANAINATPEQEWKAYKDLLYTLTGDFVATYNLYNKDADGLCSKVMPFIMEHAPTEVTWGTGKCMISADKQSIRIELYMNRIKNEQTQRNVPLPVLIISLLAHELSHALDRLDARKTALGPQIHTIDDKIYDTSNKNNYYKSATEIQAYDIQAALETLIMHNLHKKRS